MTIAEAIVKAEEILGTIPVFGRENVRKISTVFEILDASVAALNAPREAQPEPPEAG